jgi:hypothetical protein
MAVIVAYVQVALQTTFDHTEVANPKAIVLLDWDTGVCSLRSSPRTCSAPASRWSGAIGLPSVMGWAAVGLALVPLVVPPGLMTIVFMLWLLGLAAMLLVQGLLAIGTPDSHNEARCRERPRRSAQRSPTDARGCRGGRTVRGGVDGSGGPSTGSRAVSRSG